MSADIAAKGAETGLVAMISEGWRRSTEAGSGDLLVIDPEVGPPALIAHLARLPSGSVAEWTRGFLRDP